MKSIICSSLVLITCFFTSCHSEPGSSADNKIVVGTIDSLYSKTLNEQRKIWVYVPAADPLYAKQAFPVVYLLDGDAHFYSVMGMIQQLSEVNMNMVLPRMILIGITNTDRTRDLTPSHVSTYGDIPDTSFFRTSGGAGKFTLFIEKELIPFVDSSYPTAPYRILIGHSYGGLFCVNTMIDHTKLFNAYLAIDPSMDWDSSKFVKHAGEVLAQKNFSGTSFYLSIANQGYSDTETSKDNEASFELARLLDAGKKNQLRYNWRYYADDNHGSVPMISEYDGLRFLLDFYNPRIPYVKFKNPSFKADSFVAAHFASVGKQMGYKYPPPESFMNWLGYLFMMEKQYDKSYRILKINIENYPASANVYDSMGELLVLMGDTAKAIENYERSYKLNPKNENAVKRVRELRNPGKK